MNCCGRTVVVVAVAVAVVAVAVVVAVVAVDAVVDDVDFGLAVVDREVN